MRELALGHSAGKWQIKGLNPGLCDSKVAFPLYLAHRGFFFSLLLSIPAMIISGKKGEVVFVFVFVFFTKLLPAPPPNPPPLRRYWEGFVKEGRGHLNWEFRSH